MEIVNDDDDDEFRFGDASSHEGHSRQNGVLTRARLFKASLA